MTARNLLWREAPEIAFGAGPEGGEKGVDNSAVCISTDGLDTEENTIDKLALVINPYGLKILEWIY
jgi:hypothetical protein